MHIPDGYLSPSTCAALYAGAAPFWYVALQKVKKLLGTKLIPLVSLFAAFSFVVMMFNLPLPGGTTGHALGVGIAAIVLGPWASILSTSTALLIQAVFFGDGGITTFGANCFNMAIVGSLVAYGVYRLLAGRSTLTSRRRLIASAIAGYTAINLAAFCAAVEFGLQPALFHDATGAPLYAPYPLRVAIPAMMLGHLTLAGAAETTLTAGIVAYLQRTNLALLSNTAPAQVVGEETRASKPACRQHEPADLGVNGYTAPARARNLWAGLALLLLLTPLGVLAVGTAWGEWSAPDFSDPAARQEIAAASLDHQPPAQPPRGLERLSSVWTAPFPAYAPAVRYRSLGYLLSAMFGAGLIILLVLAGGWVAVRRTQRALQASPRGP